MEEPACREGGRPATDSVIDRKIISNAKVKTLEKPDLYVIARFVEVLHRKGAMKKTNLQMSTGLNYSAFLRYLEWSMQHQLVEITIDEGEGELVKLSVKGVQAYERLVSWIRDTMEGLEI